MADSILPFDISQYSIPERMAMIGEIWDSMVDDAGVVPLTDEQKNILDQRIAESEEFPDDVVPWSEIQRRIFEERK